MVKCDECGRDIKSWVWMFDREDLDGMVWIVCGRCAWELGVCGISDRMRVEDYERAERRAKLRLESGNERLDRWV